MNKKLLFLLLILLFLSCTKINEKNKLEREQVNMINWNKSVVRIKHHEREIYGVSYIPEVEEKYPIVIFSHGFNGIHKDFTMEAEYLVERGIGSYCFDFSGGSVRSKSSLKTTEMTIFTEKEDLSAIIDKVKTWEKVDKENIFLFGGSQGGLVTALTAEDYKEDIKGMLLLFPAFCIPDNWSNRFQTKESIPETLNVWGVNLGKSFFETIYNYNVFENIGKFNKNVLIFQGDKDDIVLVEDTKKATKFYKNSKLEIFTGEKHGFTREGNEKVVKMVHDFVRENI